MGAYKEITLVYTEDIVVVDFMTFPGGKLEFSRLRYSLASLSSDINSKCGTVTLFLIEYRLETGAFG